MKLSNTAVIVPAYNEEKNLSKLIKPLKKYVDTVIVVDDASKDKTSDVAKREGAIVLKHVTNKGKGEALKTAFAYIKKNPKIKYVALIDADLQFAPSEILKVLKPLDGIKFVMGKRNWKKVPFRHALGNLVWRTLFNFLYGTHLKDTNCGLMAFSTDILNKLEVGGGYITENMMLASAVKNNIPITQVPINVSYHIIHGIPRGAQVVSGVFFFILKDGIKYRLSKLF